MEPYKFEMDDDNNVKNEIGFDAETGDVKKTLINSIASAAGNRPWSPFWYDRRDLMKNFYNEFLQDKSPDKRQMFKDILNKARTYPECKDCEVLIVSLIGITPKNPGFSRVITFAYDIAENKSDITRVQRMLPRDRGTLKFKEDLGDLIGDLCEKLYKDDKKTR